MSEFSDTLFVRLNNSFNILSTACVNSEVEVIIFNHENKTPVFNWDGGTVLSNTDSKYYVAWNTTGTKNIEMIIDNDTSKLSIQILDAPSADFIIPTEVFAGNITEINLPNVIPSLTTFTSEITEPGNPNFGKGIPQSLRPYVSAIPGKKKGSIYFPDGVNYINKDFLITITVSSKTGCSNILTQMVKVLPPMPKLEIDIVSQENNHNVITWRTTAQPENTSNIVIFKEGVAYNTFEVLAIVEPNTTSFADLTSNTNIRSERYCLAWQHSGGIIGPKGKPHQTVHAMINKGMGNSYNLFWNKYDGADILSYYVKRGTTPENMQVIATLPGSNMSFSDINPPTDVYYIIEYEKEYDEYQFKSIKKNTKAPQTIKGKGNIVYSNNAASMVTVSKLNILTLEKEAKLISSQRNLHLYAEVLPKTATIQNVKWEITNGNHLASIDYLGNLKNLTGGTGSITVKATSLDGSNINNTLTIPFSIPFKATIYAGEHGVLSYDGELDIEENTYIEVYPEEGYQVDKIYRNNIEWMSNVSNGFWINTLTEDVEIYVTFKAKVQTQTYTITPFAGENGSISPNIIQTVNEGDNVTFFFTPDLGYVVEKVLVNDLSVDFNNNQYTITNIIEDIAISVTFREKADVTYSITPFAGENGSITPNNVQTVNEGDDITFYFAPNLGYVVEKVLINDISVNFENNQYTIFGITENKTISVYFTDALSNDASLKSLTISSGTLNPSFNPAIYTYTVTVENNISEITIEGVPNNLNASVNGNGVITLNEGVNNIDITVTAEDGMTEKIYTIEVTRRKTSNILMIDNLLNGINAYPNPTTGIVYIETLDNKVPAVKVYSTTGILLFKTRNSFINLSTLPNGLYNIEINEKIFKIILNK